MAFDESKDKQLQEWTIQGDNDSKVCIGVYQYNDGPIKIQIGPRLIEKKSGGDVRVKTGRLSHKEFLAVVNLATKIAKVVAKASK